MLFYDKIKLNSELKYFFIWDSEDNKIIRASFSEKIILNIKRRENRKLKTKFEIYFFEKRELPKIEYKFSEKLTDFEKRVLKETEKIPFGKKITYKELAQRVKSPRAYRAVGNALGKNPLPVIIPCHRIVSSKGLGGFTGGVHIKKFLLNLES